MPALLPKVLVSHVFLRSQTQGTSKETFQPWRNQGQNIKCSYPPDSSCTVLVITRFGRAVVILLFVNLSYWITNVWQIADLKILADPSLHTLHTLHRTLVISWVCTSLVSITIYQLLWLLSSERIQNPWMDDKDNTCKASLSSDQVTMLRESNSGWGSARPYGNIHRRTRRYYYHSDLFLEERCPSVSNSNMGYDVHMAAECICTSGCRLELE